MKMFEIRGAHIETRYLEDNIDDIFEYYFKKYEGYRKSFKCIDYNMEKFIEITNLKKIDFKYLKDIIKHKTKDTMLYNDVSKKLIKKIQDGLIAVPNQFYFKYIDKENIHITGKDNTDIIFINKNLGKNNIDFKKSTESIINLEDSYTLNFNEINSNTAIIYFDDIIKIFEVGEARNQINEIPIPIPLMDDNKYKYIYEESVENIISYRTEDVRNRYLKSIKKSFKNNKFNIYDICLGKVKNYMYFNKMEDKHKYMEVVGFLISNIINSRGLEYIYNYIILNNSSEISNKNELEDGINSRISLYHFEKYFDDNKKNILYKTLRTNKNKDSSYFILIEKIFSFFNIFEETNEIKDIVKINILKNYNEIQSVEYSIKKEKNIVHIEKISDSIEKNIKTYKKYEEIYYDRYLLSSEEIFNIKKVPYGTRLKAVPILYLEKAYQSINKRAYLYEKDAIVSYIINKLSELEEYFGNLENKKIDIYFEVNNKNIFRRIIIKSNNIELIEKSSKWFSEKILASKINVLITDKEVFYEGVKVFRTNLNQFLFDSTKGCLDLLDYDWRVIWNG